MSNPLLNNTEPSQDEEALKEQVSRIIIENRGEDGYIDAPDQLGLFDEVMQLIADRERQAYKQGYIDGGIATLTNPKQQTGEK